MALDGQVVNIPFGSGINTKVDPKQVSAGELIAIENAVFTNPQELRKRPGNAALGTSILAGAYSLTFPAFASAPTTGSFLASFKDQTLMGDGFNLFAHSNADNKWSYKGRLESARVGTSQIWQDENDNINSDSCVNTTSGLTLYAWESWDKSALETSSVYLGVGYAIADTATGQILFSAALANTTSRPRCIAIAGLQYLFYYDSSGTALKAFSVSSTAPGSPTTIANNIDTTLPNYDVLVIGSNIYVGYNGTGSTVKVSSFSSALASVASVSKAEVASNGVGIFTDTSSNVWVAYNNSTETKAFIMNSALAVTVLAPTLVDGGAAASGARNVTGIYNGTLGIIFYDKPGLPTVTQDSGITIGVNYTQPAVGAIVGISTGGATDAELAALAGKIVYVPTGGYYYFSIATNGAPVLINVGYTGNAAPGATVNQPQNIFNTAGYDNAIVTRNTLTAAGTAGTAATLIRACALASRAFAYNNIAHVYVVHDSALQPNYFLASLYNINSLSSVQIAHVAAKLFENEAGGIPNKSVLSSVNLLSAGNYQIALPRVIYNIQRTFENNITVIPFHGVSQATLNLAPRQISREEIGSNTHVASGTLMMYDGVQAVEHGFHLFPDWIKVAETGTAGNIEAGDYAYCAVYQWIDAQGQIHRSAPSTPQSITAAGNFEIEVTVSTLRVTQKDSVTIAVYRTLKNQSGPFYRIDTNLTTYPISNSLVVDIAVIPDFYSDAEISGNEQLYTSFQIENIVSPSPISLSKFKNRLLIVPADDDTTEWYSQQVIPGSPVETNDTFVQNTDQSSGGIRGSVQLDDKWIQFKKKGLYYTVGTGPAPLGTNNDFTDPTEIATDVGLIDFASIVKFPDGVIFKSSKGIYLLDRSLQVSYIGAKVEAYNSYTVYSAKLVEDLNQIRFVLSSGQAIVYDYFIKAWTVFTNYGFIDSEVNGGNYYALKSDGTVLLETPGVFSDNGSFISIKIVTAWLGLSGLQGFQRVWQMMILGEYVSAHQLSVKFAYDFNSTVFQSVTINPTNLLPYQWQVGPARQKCDTMQVTVQDVSTGTLGESCRLSALSFYAGVKKGTNKVGPAQSAG